MASESSGRIFDLLNIALSRANAILPGEDYANQLVENCLALYSKDYVCITVSNSKGTLCGTYPAQLIIPLKEKARNSKKCSENFDGGKLLDLIQQSKLARTRGRFPAPVLLFSGKYICRSSTLARAPEMYLYSFQNHYFPSTDREKLVQENGHSNGQMLGNGIDMDHAVASAEKHGSSVKFTVLEEADNEDPTVVLNGGGNVQTEESLQSPDNDVSKSKEWLLDKMRNADINLLNFLKTSVICDLMVENYKVKFGMSVTSSEKVDRQQRYKSRFNLVSIPYPGCEFFADYTRNHYQGVGLKFDWSQQFIDAQLQVPDDMENISDINWNDYMQWDLVELTQNYLKLILNSIAQPNCSGLLLHCISGWDRTPLFVSLVRLSLWADGLIHQSLNANDIVYLTLAYDWLLFSHQFANRVDKREEIMHFCFDFLTSIASEEYSLLTNSRYTEELSAVDENEPVAEEVFHLESCDSEQPAADCRDYNGVADNVITNNHQNGHFACKDSPARQKNGIWMHEIPTLPSTCNSHPESDLQEIKQCVDNLVDDVSSLGLKEVDSVGNLPSIAVCNAPAIVSVTHSEWSTNCAPVEHSTKDDCVHLHNTVGMSDGCIKNKAIPSTKIHAIPPSALSSSFETAKNSISQATYDPSDQKCNGLTSSCDTRLDDVRSSSPITIPKHIRNKSPSADSLSKEKADGSPATNHSMAEPGSSWQMVPSDSNFYDLTSSTVSGGQSSRKSSFASSLNGSPETDTLKMKLARRKERLQSAKTSMIPAYSAAIHLQQQRQKQQGGTISSIVGHIANFVTGS